MTVCNTLLLISPSHSCFIGDVRVFFAAFLGPIFAVLLFNLVTFIIVIVVLIRHTRNKLGKTTDARKQRKSNIRLAMSLFGIMILFGLTWVLGAFTISEASLTFQILFAIFNSLQGFFIFIFFCVLNKDVRQLWLERVTCGRYVKSKSSYTSGGKKDLSTGQLHSGVKQKSLAGTTSTGLSSLPSSKHAADSFIELSEYPSSTVIDNEFSVSTMEKEHRGPPPQLISQPPTSSHAHFFKNPAVEGEVQATRGTSKLGAYESMRATMDF